MTITIKRGPLSVSPEIASATEYSPIIMNDAGTSSYSVPGILNNSAMRASMRINNQSTSLFDLALNSDYYPQKLDPAYDYIDLFVDGSAEESVGNFRFEVDCDESIKVVSALGCTVVSSVYSAGKLRAELTTTSDNFSVRIKRQDEVAGGSLAGLADMKLARSDVIGGNTSSPWDQLAAGYQIREDAIRPFKIPQGAGERSILAARALNMGGQVYKPYSTLSDLIGIGSRAWGLGIPPEVEGEFYARTGAKYAWLNTTLTEDVPFKTAYYNKIKTGLAGTTTIPLVEINNEIWNFARASTIPCVAIGFHMLGNSAAPGYGKLTGTLTSGTKNVTIASGAEVLIPSSSTIMAVETGTNVYVHRGFVATVSGGDVTTDSTFNGTTGTYDLYYSGTRDLFVPGIVATQILLYRELPLLDSIFGVGNYKTIMCGQAASHRIDEYMSRTLAQYVEPSIPEIKTFVNFLGFSSYFGDNGLSDTLVTQWATDQTGVLDALDARVDADLSKLASAMRSARNSLDVYDTTIGILPYEGGQHWKAQVNPTAIEIIGEWRKRPQVVGFMRRWAAIQKQYYAGVSCFQSTGTWWGLYPDPAYSGGELIVDAYAQGILSAMEYSAQDAYTHIA